MQQKVRETGARGTEKYEGTDIVNSLRRKQGNTGRETGGSRGETKQHRDGGLQGETEMQEGKTKLARENTSTTHEGDRERTLGR